MGCRICKGDGLIVARKLIMTIVILIILSAVTQFFCRFDQTVGTGITVVRRRSVIRAVKRLFSGISIKLSKSLLRRKSADVVNVAVQNLTRINSLSVMYIQCIKFFCKMHIILTAASNRTNLLHPVVVFKNTHQSCDRTFYRSFVYHIGTFDTGLRNGTVNVIEHDRIRSFPTDLFINDLSGQVAAYFSFRQCLSLIKRSCFGCNRFGFRLRLRFRLRLCLGFWCFLCTASKYGTCHQYSRQNC